MQTMVAGISGITVETMRRLLFIFFTLLVVLFLAFYLYTKTNVKSCEFVCSHLIVGDNVYPSLTSLDSLGEWKIEGVSDFPDLVIPKVNNTPVYCLCKVVVNDEKVIAFQVMYDKWYDWFNGLTKD